MPVGLQMQLRVRGPRLPTAASPWPELGVGQSGAGPARGSSSSSRPRVRARAARSASAAGPCERPGGVFLRTRSRASVESWAPGAEACRAGSQAVGGRLSAGARPRVLSAGLVPAASGGGRRGAQHGGGGSERPRAREPAGSPSPASSHGTTRGAPPGRGARRVTAGARGAQPGCREPTAVSVRPAVFRRHLPHIRRVALVAWGDATCARVPFPRAPPRGQRTLPRALTSPAPPTSQSHPRGSALPRCGGNGREWQGPAPAVSALRPLLLWAGLWVRPWPRLVHTPGRVAGHTAFRRPVPPSWSCQDPLLLTTGSRRVHVSPMRASSLAASGAAWSSTCCAAMVGNSPSTV